jgi:hypothetical protein
LSLFAALKKKNQGPLLWEACRALNMEQEAAGEVVDNHNSVDGAEISVVSVNIETEQVACLPFGIGDTVTDLARMLVVVAPAAALGAPFEVLVFPERHPVQCIHDFLSHHRWHRGFALVKEEGSLTSSVRCCLPFDEN